MCNEVNHNRKPGRYNSPIFKFDGGITSFLFLILVLPCVAQVQNPVASAPAPIASDLARKNMAHVAASPVQIEPILRNNPGLLLELKGWMAREAANQGRILTDADLADLAVFDRLRVDSAFRAIATRLLQRYGYLAPELNPDSPAGKRQDFAMKERIKVQLAQEEQLPTPVTPAPTNVQNRAVCDPDDEDDADCDQTGVTRPSPTTIERDETPLMAPTPPRTNPITPDYSLRTTTDRASSESTEENPQAKPVSATSMDGLNPGMMDNRQPSSSFGMDRLSAMAQGLSTDDMMSAAAKFLLGTQPSEEPVPTDSAQPIASGTTTGIRRSANTLRASERPAPPAMVRVRNPYESIPALYDMYMQAPDPSGEPKRFGAEVFKRSTKAALKVPMDMPAGPDYVVGPGDSLTINLWGGISQRFVRQIDREGRVALPVVGPVLVAGKTLDDAQRSVQLALRNEFRDVSADVSLSKLRTVRVYVVGDVARPGAYDISALSTALNALFLAGGPTANGSLRVVRHYRGQRLLEEVDVYDLILKGVRSSSYPLENGDTILVPPIGPQVTVNGAVRRPALYEVHGEANLSDVLDLAGGMLPTAALTHIEVQRLIAHESKTMLSLNITDQQDATAVSRQLAAFKVEPGDVIQIFPIAPFNRDAVYLQGHVVRPGRYSYRKEMRLSDLVSSYSDLLPEPAAQYAEIIRLLPPAYTPQVFSFNLAEALSKPAASPLLQPLDTVRIFGRYDFEDAPTVTVTGAVRRPGTYRTAGQIHVSDAVHLGGNLTIDALHDDAQVVHHQPDGTIQVMNVNLRQAEAGDPINNILLASGDRVLVHESQAKANPATVTVEGEVANPGHYPLSSDLKVSDLIRLAGGLKRSADTSTADLVHYMPADAGEQLPKRDAVQIEAALHGQPENDKALHDGDVLTIRRVEGWDDVGASVTLAGEVEHPGTYGFHPGERLSSVLRRAGGFSPNAYPYAAVLVRSDVREMQDLNRAELVRRLQTEEQQLKLLPDSDADQKKSKEAVLQQVQSSIRDLVNNAALGRVVIHISPNIDHWANSSNDIQLRAGDRLTVPKRIESVSIIGQVYNTTAVSYRRGKSAEWYLGQAGGPTNLANKKAIFVLRADGSVIGGQKGSFFGGNALKSSLAPGDTVVVPEKAFTTSHSLQNALLLAQVASAIASIGYFASISLP